MCNLAKCVMADEYEYKCEVCMHNTRREENTECRRKEQGVVGTGMARPERPTTAKEPKQKQTDKEER